MSVPAFFNKSQSIIAARKTAGILEQIKGNMSK